MSTSSVSMGQEVMKSESNTTWSTFPLWFPTKMTFHPLVKPLHHFSFGSDGAASQFMWGWWGPLGVGWRRGWSGRSEENLAAWMKKKMKTEALLWTGTNTKSRGKEKKWEWNCRASDSPARRRNFELRRTSRVALCLVDVLIYTGVNSHIVEQRIHFTNDF